MGLAVTVVDEDVAAGGAAGAHGVGRFQEPDAHLEAEIVGEQRAHRADVGEVARVVVRDGAVEVAGDLGVVAAAHELEAVGSGDVALETQAARAEHAALGVEHDGPEVHHLALGDLLLHLHPGLVETVLHVVVLQVALARLVTDRAIDGVVDEQELERGPVRLHRLLAVGLDHQAVRDRGVAGDLQLGRLLDLDQAHAAVAVHHQVGVPAEVGDLDAQHERGLDDRGPGRNLDLSTVDRALGHAYLLNAESAEDGNARPRRERRGTKARFTNAHSFISAFSAPLCVLCVSSVSFSDPARRR
jgi:hypothetical protein